MEFLKKLKAKSVSRLIFPVILLALLMAVCVALSDVWLLFQKPVDLYSVPREELEGKYVTVELPHIYTAYAVTEEYENNRPTGTITSKEYIIDANRNDFCGLVVDGGMVEQADELLEQGWEYENGEIDAVTATFTVKGIMERMPEDSLEFYYEVAGFDDMSEEEREIFLPYYLVARGSSDTFRLLITMGLAVFCQVVILVLLIPAIRGKNQKQMLEKAKALCPANPEYILEQVGTLYEEQKGGKGLCINERFVLATQGNKNYLYATGELVWAHVATVRHRVYFIPVATDYNLILSMSDGKQIAVRTTQKRSREQLALVRACNPNCYLGYSQQLAQLYKNDPRNLVRQ